MRIAQVILVLILLAGVASARASTITVNTLEDSTAADGLCSLREAIRNANAAGTVGNNDCVGGEAAGNIVAFDPGLTGGKILLSGQALPTITRTLEIVGPLAPLQPITIDGNSQSRLLIVNGSVELRIARLDLVNGTSDENVAHGGIMLAADGAQVELVHMNISGGLTSGNNTRGGAIAVIDSKLYLDNVSLEDNESLLTAGALYARESQVTAIDSNFQANRSRGGTAVELLDSQAVFNRTIFSGNEQPALGFSGGAIRSLNSELELMDTLFTQNVSSAGSAIWADGGELTLRNSEIRDNVAIQSGTVAFTNGSFLIDSTTIAANQITGVGAGAFSVSDANGQVVNSTLSGNSTGSASGGAFRLSRSQVELLHTTVANNISPGNEVFVFGSAESPASLHLLNSLFFGDQCQAGSNSEIISIGTISDAPGCAPLLTPSDLIELQSLASVSGSTEVHALGPGSVAIDAAGNCLGAYGIENDQLGSTRPGGDQGSCDAGAYENGGPSPKADLSLDLALSSMSAEPGQSVSLTIQLDQAGPSPAGLIKVSLTLPGDLTVINAQPDLGDFDPGLAEWIVPAVAPGSSSQLVLTLVGEEPGSFSITGQASSYTLDPDAANNSDEVLLMLIDAEDDQIFSDRFVQSSSTYNQHTVVAAIPTAATRSRSTELNGADFKVSFHHEKTRKARRSLNRRIIGRVGFTGDRGP